MLVHTSRNTKLTFHRFLQASSFTLHHLYPALVLPDGARDDLVGGGRLFWPETTYRVPASGVRSVGVGRMARPNVGVDGGAGVSQKRTARADMVAGGCVLPLCAREAHARGQAQESRRAHPGRAGAPRVAVAGASAGVCVRARGGW